MSKLCNLRYSISNKNGLVEIAFSIKPNFFQKIIHCISSTKYNVLFVYEYDIKNKDWFSKNSYNCCPYYINNVVEEIKKNNSEFKEKINELL